MSVNKYPPAYHRGYMHRENGMQNAQPYSISSECADYHWYAAGWNDADIELKKRIKLKIRKTGDNCKRLSHTGGKLNGTYSVDDVKAIISNIKSWKLFAKKTGFSYGAVRSWASDNGISIRHEKAN